MRPAISWYFFNLFRLVAVVFMVWALAAQFIALAGDLGQLSNPSKSPASTLSNLSSSSTTLSRTTTRPISSIPPGTIPSSSSILITNSVVPTPIRSNTITAVQLGPEAITRTPPLVRPLTTALAAPIVDDGPLVVADAVRRSLNKRAEEAKPTSGVVGLSSVPTTTGGAMFASMSRIIMASALVFLLLVQLGIPEMWLYKNVPALGPQSTPLWLGVGQTIIAVEGLRVYSIPLVWAAHAGLLVIGMINSHAAIGLILLARRRKLPKSPAPPLYFSRTTRLLFFRPLPACYIQLLSKEEQEHIVNTNLELAQDNLESDPEAGGEDSGPWKMRLKRNISGPIRKPSDGLNDVRRGGYPTFAEGGLGAVGSQIPASTIDVAPDGRMRGLIARPLGDRKSLETTGDAYSGFADDDSRAPSRADTLKEVMRKGSTVDKKEIKNKRKPPPLGLGPVGSVGNASQPEQRQLLRQRSITAFREKIEQRMEGKAAADGEVVTEMGPPRVLPTITTTAPSAGFGPGRRSTMIDSANTFGRQPTILRSIPKRGNTISQASVLPPTARPHLPERSSSQSQVGAGQAPIPIAKSPKKSVGEANFSSSLPWARSKPGSPVEHIPTKAKLPDQVAHRATHRQTSILAAPRDPSSARANQDNPPNSSGLYNTALVGALETMNADSASLNLPAATVTRTPSGSKLQKVRKPEVAVPLRLPKPPSRSGTILLSGNKESGLNRQASLKPPIQDTGRRSPNTLLKKRTSPSPIPISPASPVSSPARPQSAQSISALQSSLRSSMAPLNRSGSVRSTTSARTAMGVRFDLEKRYSTSSSDADDDDNRESLLSPETNRSTRSTPRSAGFRIPGTKLKLPFLGTPKTKNRPISESTSTASSSPGYDVKESDLFLEMGDSDDDGSLEAARPESFASQSTIGSMKEKGSRLNEGDAEVKVVSESRKPVVGERAGLPKRATSMAVTTKPSKRGEDPVLGGQYIDGGKEGDWKRAHIRRPSSISIDSRR